MQCQECQQRPATLYFQQIVNGEKRKVHVCEVCAQEKGYLGSAYESYSLHDLLTGLFNFDTSQLSSQPVQQTQQTKETQCPKCNMTFAEFKQIGKMGCASCYETFSERMEPILRRVHSGNTKHSGKIPKRIGGSIQKRKLIEEYRNQMKVLVEEEAFEKAAELRDKIKVMEKESSVKKEGSEE